MDTWRIYEIGRQASILWK